MTDPAPALTSEPTPTAHRPHRRSAVPSPGPVGHLLLSVGAVLIGIGPVLWPLVLPGLPGTNDGQFHLYRLFFLHESLRTEGSPGRWLADVAYGYGAPVFNYYAPASYLPGLAAVLAGTGYVVGLEVAFGFAVALSALAMFVLARSLFGLISAIVAGLVYAYLPYQLLDLYIRGALAESMAFVWLPLIPWCL
jgi:hypothetical protein